MIDYRHRRFGMSLFIAGAFALLMSLNGGWGDAYGQTAGPTPQPNSALLRVTKEADNPNPRVGDTVVFIIRVTNVGDQPARAVEVVDTMPNAFEIVSSMPTVGTVAVSGQTVTLTIPELQPGETAVLTIETRVRAGATGQLVNQVVVRGIDANGTALSDNTAQTVVDVATDEQGDGAASPRGQTGPGHGNAGTPRRQVGPADGGNAGGPRNQLGATGADDSLQWWLTALGVLLVISGSAIYLRARKAR